MGRKERRDRNGKLLRIKIENSVLKVTPSSELLGEASAQSPSSSEWRLLGSACRYHIKAWPAKGA